jgi:ActR/RegA family two-component response regulator
MEPANLGVTIDSVLVRNQTLAATELDGRVVVLNVHTDSYVSLNAVASDIWRMLSEPCRVGQIFDALLQSHDVDADTLSRDVLPFLRHLIERRLARQIDGAVGR